MLHEFEGQYPEVPSQVFIAPGAQVIGDVQLAEGVSVWYNTVIRGDFDSVKIGEKTNIQDGSVCHVDYDQPLSVGDYVTVGHSAILHGCRIGNATLIGMGSTIMNGVTVGDNCIIAAGTVIPEGKEIPNGSLVMGVPGKIVRELSEAEQSGLAEGAENYFEKAKRYLEIDKQSQ